MRLGIVGAGQLGLMLGQAAQPLGIRCTFLDPHDAPPAGAAGEVIRAAYDDVGALEELARRSDVVTYEFENVPVEAARWLSARLPVHPPPEALASAQDRLVEKDFLRARGIDTAPYAPIDGTEDLRRAVDALGLPALLKTRRLGYDGKGQRALRPGDPLDGAYAAVGARPSILEGHVPFDRELSILGVRGRDGVLAFWPLVENHHEGGILRWSVCPAEGVDGALQAQAESIARRLLEGLDYVGVLAVELFQVGDRLLANEIAPRVHNSGHWTIEGAETSQFENHVRAVCGLPLGSTRVPRPVACVNLLGRVPPLSDLLAVPGAHVHLYGKAPRAGRKLGHVTITAESRDELAGRLAAIRALAS